MNSPVSREDLLSTTKSLCDAFASQAPLDDLLSFFSTDSTHDSESNQTATPLAIEYAHSALTPYTNRPFCGRSGIKEYFTLISSILSYSDMTFPAFAFSESGNRDIRDTNTDYIVDTQTMRVSIKGRARFVWKNTGVGWDETFVWWLSFVREPEGKLKVSKYEVWADSGAAFLAKEGKSLPAVHA